MKIAHRLPFDWAKPLSYSFAVLLELYMVWFPLRFISCFLTLGFSGLVFSFSIVKDVRDRLDEFNKIAKTKQPLPNIFEPLFVLIRFTNLRELSSSNCKMAKFLNENQCGFFSALKIAQLHRGHFANPIDTYLYWSYWSVMPCNALDSSRIGSSKFYRCSNVSIAQHLIVFNFLFNFLFDSMPLATQRFSDAVWIIFLVFLGIVFHFRYMWNWWTNVPKFVWRRG